MPLLNDQDAAFLRRRLGEEMEHDVRLVFFAPSAGGLTLPGQDWEMAEYTRRILQEVAGLTDRVSLEEHSLASEPEAAAQYGIAHTPAVAVVGAQDYGVRFYGMPAGYEFVTLVDVILDVSKGRAPVSSDTRAALADLPGDAHLRVFVTPTCPYCPRAARLAAALAIASPRVRADIVEATEFPELAQHYAVYAVPKTVINETQEVMGAVPESEMVRAVLAAAGGQQPAPGATPSP